MTPHYSALSAASAQEKNLERGKISEIRTERRVDRDCVYAGDVEKSVALYQRLWQRG
jgi:hypothetical protein